MSKTVARKTQSKMLKPQRSADVPVTLRHLELVKQELKSDITSVSLETSSLRLETSSLRQETAGLRQETSGLRQETSGLRQETAGLRQETAGLRQETSSLRLEMKAGFKKIEADMSQIKSAVFQMQALLEEQNSRNRVALDGYAVVYEKQNSTEDRVRKLEKKVFGAEQE